MHAFLSCKLGNALCTRTLLATPKIVTAGLYIAAGTWLVLSGMQPAFAQVPEAAAASTSKDSDKSSATVINKPPVRTLDIFEYLVEGNSVLDDAAIGDAVEPFLGPGKAADDVDKARAALEDVYHARGYKTVSVAIPRQTVRNGVVHLQVIEGHIGHLEVVGSQYHSIDQIKAEAPSLAEGAVPDFNQVQKDIVTLNQQADRKVTPALKAGATPDTVDIDLVVDDHLPLHGSVEINNRKSQDTSELRTVGSLSYDNLWQLGHSVSVSYQTAPENQNDARVIYGSYLARFGSSPFNLLVNGIDTNSNVSTVGGTDVIGKGQVAGIRGIWTLPGNDAVYRSLTAGVDYKHFKNLTALGGQGFETPVTYFPFTVAYDVVQRFPASALQANFTFTFANPKIGSTTDTLKLSRATGARGQQFSYRGSFSWTQDLPHGTQSLLRFSGQYTDQVLITNEQFSAGGWDTVRGYLEAEALGDLGFDGTIEIRSPALADSLRPGKGRLFEDFRVIAFVDGADLTVHEPANDQQSQFGLASFGAGASFKVFSFLSGAIDWADPILSGPATRAWSSRALFRVWTSF